MEFYQREKLNVWKAIGFMGNTAGSILLYRQYREPGFKFGAGCFSMALIIQSKELYDSWKRMKYLR